MEKSILVVDTTSFIRSIIKDILNKAGYNVVVEAVNGIEAVEKFKVNRPDLVFMEILLPEMDGLSACKAMKEIDPGVPVVLCSKMGQEVMVIEAIKAGASDFIVKPFKADRIIKTVQCILG